MKKMTVQVAAVALAALMILAGCSKKDGAQATGEASTKPSGGTGGLSDTYGDPAGTHFELWVFVELHGKMYGKMAEEWNKLHPDRPVEVTVTAYPYGGMHTNLITSLTTNSGAPDICDVEVSQFPNVVEGIDKWLYPLDEAAAPYMPTMVKSRMDTYAGADGKHYGAPFHVGATVMYWNLAVLSQYGITQEDIDSVTTWEDYEALGMRYLAALDEAGERAGKYFTSVDTGGTDWLWLAMAEYGEDWTGGHGGRANVELESVRNMLTMQQKWLDMGLAEVSPDGHVDLEAGFQNILDHNIVSFPKAMWYMSRFTDYMPEEKGSWYITPCPVFEVGQKRSVGIGGTGTVVTQQAKNKELAAEWLCWAKMSEEGEKQIWAMLGFDVCNTALWDDPEFAHDDTNKFNQFFINYPYDVLATIADEIGMISVVKISTTINEQMNGITFNSVLEDGEDVDEALKEAQAAIDLEQ